MAEKPLVIVANTVKGKGVSFMENQFRWHGATPKVEEAEIAKRELGIQIVLCFAINCNYWRCVRSKLDKNNNSHKPTVVNSTRRLVLGTP